MDLFRTYIFATSAWLVLQSLVLGLAPKIVVLVLVADTRQPTDLETYFCRALGLSQTAFAVLLVALLSSMPTKSDRAGVKDSAAVAEAMAPASAMMVVTGTLHVASAIFTYVRFNSTGQLGFAAGSAVSAVFAAASQWIVLFGQDDVHLSRRTGKDKHVSNWPLGEWKSKRVPASEPSG